MTTELVQDIISRHAFPGKPDGVTLVETHISWVILTPDFAFKIKKPLKLHFLDFSTPELRLHSCSEELRLNRRLASNMYLDVLPIGIENDHPEIGSAAPPILDYAVQMRRIDSTRQMDLLLKQDAVSPADMENLAALLARFHLRYQLTSDIHLRIEQEISDFNDLFTLNTTLLSILGPESEPALHNLEKQATHFLQKHETRLLERASTGFWADGHGDLHTRNIFLTPAPIVFDCIEFNPHFRRLDVLNELAFLCMDLECRGRSDLSAVFMKAYGQHRNILPKPEDALLFQYFKLYRANVRMKVAALEWQQHGLETSRDAVAQYWNYMAGFADASGVFL
jgi:hypothetical protein